MTRDGETRVLAHAPHLFGRTTVGLGAPGVAQVVLVEHVGDAARRRRRLGARRDREGVLADRDGAAAPAGGAPSSSRSRPATRRTPEEASRSCGVRLRPATKPDAQLQRQCDVLDVDRALLGIVEVGDGARHPPDAMQAAPGEPPMLELVAQLGGRLGGQRRALVEARRGQRRVQRRRCAASSMLEPPGRGRARPRWSRRCGRRSGRRRRSDRRRPADRSDRAAAPTAASGTAAVNPRRTRTRRAHRHRTDTGWWPRPAGTAPAGWC